MNKKTFLLGIVTGIITTFVILYIIGLANSNSKEDDPIQYFEEPLSYENKKETSFKVFQVLGSAALAREISDNERESYYGNTVVILGDNFYCDQIVVISNPERVGTYNYTNNGGRDMTVPVIEGEICE